MATIQGNFSYSLKDQITRLGGRWDGSARHWIAPDDKANQVIELLSGAPKKQVAPAGGYKPAGVSRPCQKCGTYCFGDCAV